MGIAPVYPLRTRRLRLRPIEPAIDVDDFYAYRSRAEVCRYAPIEPLSRNEAVTRLETIGQKNRRLQAEGEALILGVEHAATSKLIGDVVLFWRSAIHRHGEIGYTINPDFQGCGYATEAGDALLRLAFGELGLHRVTARIDERHTASLSVAHNLGMRQEATSVDCQWLKGEWITLTEWAILEHEFHGTPRASPEPLT